MIKITVDSAVVPYVRMTRRGKFVDPRARTYLSNRNALVLLIRDAMYSQLTEKELSSRFAFRHTTPLKVTIEFEVLKLHVGDIDNLAKAVIDAGQHMLYANDSWIDELHVTRKKSTHPRFTLTIEEKPNEEKGYQGKGKKKIPPP